MLVFAKCALPTLKCALSNLKCSHVINSEVSDLLRVTWVALIICYATCTDEFSTIFTCYATCADKVKLVQMKHSTNSFVTQFVQMRPNLCRWGVEHSTIFCYATCANEGWNTTIFICYATYADEVKRAQIRGGIQNNIHFLCNLCR